MVKGGAKLAKGGVKAAQAAAKAAKASQATVKAGKVASKVAKSAEGVGGVAKGLNKVGRVSTKNKDRREAIGSLRAARYSKEWESTSLKSVIDNFAPGCKGMKTSTGKTIYRDSDTGIQIVVDDAGRYFRIENSNLTGKRRYLDLNGSVPNNKTLKGKTMGRSQKEYNQATHFNNSD